MVNESEQPKPFYSNEFQEWADFVLQRDFNMRREDITQAVCRDMYLHLLSESLTSDVDT